MNRRRSFCEAEKENNILFMKTDLYLKTLTINIEKFLTFNPRITKWSKSDRIPIETEIMSTL
ncbi:hypothetical protein T01_11513 [Trichinella spiralis]|uniref:Uncharacterized protein n=1 Tax=Trichinella spiralis TaxID=6334 RepID=A0A0V1ASG7_TRISP|nr:hypothetical protein T01_6201 [Trichinella spiralis]KRY27123.1 hypothetical protein T01_11513 [Trichinella spiralis]